MTVGAALPRCMSRLVTALALVVLFMLAVPISGCSSLPAFLKPEPDVAPPSAAASAPVINSDRADYKIDVQAPDDLRKILLNYLDLARFQDAPATEGINAAELERLMRATPAQARGLLETEGYFNAEVRVEREDVAGSVPLLHVIVVPGPRATVAAFTFEINRDAKGDLPTSPALAQELDKLRAAWPLKAGAPFRQAAWSDAKNAAIARLRADGWANAGWVMTEATVDAPSNRVTIAVQADSGPLYRLGEIRVEGLSRYEAESITRLATFSPGDAYNEQLLLDFQERVQKVGLFEGASVVIDPDPANSAAAPVIVKVKELTLQQATFGIGYSANTGPRFSVEHYHRNLFHAFGTPWIAKNKFEIGPSLKSWTGELTSHPLPNLYRNLLAGSVSELRTDDQIQTAWSVRVGRAQETPRFDRLYYLEQTHTRLEGGDLVNTADATTANVNWIRRRLDSVLLPTRGDTLSLQGAAGYGFGRLTVDGAVEKERGPFSRLYGRYTLYQPFGNGWYSTFRAEAGQVLTRSKVYVPDTALFRAGGDESVRGYGYRTLGPVNDGVIVSGKVLLTGSAEIARPISPKYPAFWWATFVDVGNAADNWKDLNPAVGYGVGLRWRSPVGPLRVDLAYGQRVQQVRVHLSVGVAF